MPRTSSRVFRAIDTLEVWKRACSRVTADTLSYARMPEHAHKEEEKDDLELPPLDGAEEEDASVPQGDDDVAIRDEDNPYDDATGNDADFTEGISDDDEESAIGDDATGVGEVEDQLPPELTTESMLGEDDAPGVAGEDFGLIESSEAVRDAGEEGFDAPEPELRAEDLPPLDAGDDDEMSVEEATDLAPVELRWDDRVFERVLVKRVGHVIRIRLRAGIVITLEDGTSLRSDDNGETFIVADHDDHDDEAFVSRGRGRALLRDGVGILRAIDDGPLTLVESTEAATAFTLLDDGSLIAAVDQPDKTRLVRIAVDGTATVVAEEDSTIEALAADPRTGVVWAGGAFGLVAYR